MINPQNHPAEPGPAPLHGDIAIVGMGCIFAGAPDVATYWQNIISKVDAVSDPPAGEWDPQVFYDPESKSNDRVYCKRGGYIGDLAEFRPLDYGVMPVTVDGGEPDQWLALRVAHEALADAGYPERPKEHERSEVILGKGTYVNRGNLTVGYHGMVVEHFLQALRNLHPEYTEAEIEEIKREVKANLPPFSADTAPALIGNIIAGRIANRLDLMGPSFTVDAACASALLAIEIGVRDLLSHKCDLVLAGGSNVNAPLPTMSLFCQLGALSRRERIRPFDKDADGTILGEGLGMVVLKRRADAERDGNRIYAIIKGVGLASDGRAVHVMAPRVEGEELALRRAYAMAGVSPDSIGLIEAHGTATPVGDQVEVQALGRIFGERRTALPSCALGSVKSMIGHTMPAAGIAGVIKTALALYHRVLPPTLNCEEPNPALHLERTPFYVNTETRPWVHGAETPRRAGVNSFGFGGINAHVVLEEHPAEEAAAPSYQFHWETEVCIIEAESREALIERGTRFSKYLAENHETQLKDLAYSLNVGRQGLPSRLAVVATSKQELAQKVALALRRLADPKCRQIKDNNGIYFFDQPLEGKLAFLFPGEGAQYPNMLLDLCLHFPEVRNCFDLADRALMHGSRSILPSDLIFPRSILPAAERAIVDKALWQIDGAVEGVLIGNWAIWTLLGNLEIRPDAIVGHSTGDYSAMLASRTIELTGEQYVKAILEWNKAHARLSTRVQVPESKLVAVAADSATVMSIANEIGGELYLAMDNCPHQVVLVGTSAAAERLIEQLRRRELIYEILPFDRPYHTPLFREYAEGAEQEFFSRFPIGAPKTETYSCTSVAHYPTNAEEIRKLYVAHWVQPVLFTNTIQKMYADGIRLFVEAGPRGNLTAFVGDILRGKPHLAMPANVPRRSGVTQINHLVGILAAQGVPMRLDYLYARRNPQIISWDGAHPPAVRRQTPLMKVALALPPLKVLPRAAKSAAMEHVAGASLPKNGTSHPPSPAPTPLPTPRPVSAGHGPAAAAKPEANRAAMVMEEYFKGIETIIETERQVMEAFLRRPRSVPAAVRDFPMLGAITSIVAGKELTAVREISLSDDIFLGDHALGGPVSITSPDLKPLVVLPLTMSMEIVAEAAAALMPGQVFSGMRDVQARHWIRVDDAPVTLQISAKRIDTSREVAVQVRNPSDGTQRTVIEAIVIFADEYPAAPDASNLSLQGERKSQLAAAALYDGRLMFHGPCFQGVESVDRSGENGVVAQLRTLPADKLFRSIPNPQFVTDPVALDAAGQLVGFWAAEYLERGFVVFPYHLERLDVYGPNRPAGERLTCHVHLQLRGNEGIRSDITIAGADGRVWMQLEGWADRRFDPPSRFHRAWIAPREATISTSWRIPLAGVAGKDDLECHRLDPLFEPGATLWKDLWASLILSRRERKKFAERRDPERSQLEWLAGRTAAKDAIRSFLRRRHGLELLPADIEITEDEYGKPIVHGTWTHHLSSVPELSISHSEGMTMAIAGDGNGRRYGIDVQVIRELQPGFEKSAMTAEEQRLLDAVAPVDRVAGLFRLWCAKEAVSKALGRGLIEGPRSVRILSFDPQTGTVEATPHGKLAAALPETAGARFTAYTALEAKYVTAVAIYEKSTT